MSAKQRLLEPLQWIKHCQKEAIGLASFAPVCSCFSGVVRVTSSTPLARQATTFGSLKAHRTKDLLSAISQWSPSGVVVDGCNSETFKDIISMMVFKQSQDVGFFLMDKKVVAFCFCMVSCGFFLKKVEANYSSSQLSPYDHLNLAMTVTLMQLTVPFAAALLLRFHTVPGGCGG